MALVLLMMWNLIWWGNIENSNVEKLVSLIISCSLKKWFKSKLWGFIGSKELVEFYQF